MSRIVIDLSCDLPPRAAPLTDQALAVLFGGFLPCIKEGQACIGLGECCWGLGCTGSGLFGVKTCVK